MGQTAVRGFVIVIRTDNDTDNGNDNVSVVVNANGPLRGPL
jgi:hypothetical protein